MTDRDVVLGAAGADAVLRALVEGIVIYGHGGEIRHINAIAKAQLALSDRELREDGARTALAHATDAAGAAIPKERAPGWRALRGETVRGEIVSTPASGGGRRWLSMSAAPVRDRQGAIVGAVVSLVDVTRQRELDRELAAQRDLLRAIVDSTPSAVFAKDLEGRYVLVNRTMARSANRTEAEMLGVTDRDLWPHAASAIRAAEEVVLAADAPRTFDEALTDHQGRRRTYATTKFPIHDADGRLRGVGGVVTDVTDERAARAEAESARAQLEAVFQAARDAIIVCDLEGRLVFVNRAAAAMSNVTRVAERKLSVSVFAERYDILRPDGTPLPIPEWPIWRIIRGESVHDVELLARDRSDGREWVLSYSGEPIRDGHGTQVLAVVIIRDITDRKSAERELAERSTLIRAISDHTPDPIYAKDREGRLRLANPATLALVGRPAHEVIGRTDLEILRDEDAARRVMENDRRVMESGTVSVIEESIPNAEGEPRVWLSTKTPYRDASGAVVGLLGISRDITERKRMEEALRDADRRKNELIAMLSHELRNPLAPIRNGIELLDRVDPTGPEARRAREVVKRQVAHLTRIVDELLDVARVTRGTMRLSCAPLDLAELAAQIAEDERSVFESQGVALHVEPTTSPVVVHGDRTRLAQVVGNLLRNAATFTPRGGRATLSVEGGDGRARIVVRDTGPGLTPELRASLFEPFTQADQALDRTRGGLGLGLTIVKGIVELHGGRVHARSDGPGAGTELVVELPLAAGGEAPPRGPDGAADERSRRVLVVEDNADAAEMIATALTMSGHVVRIARNGREGLELAAQFRPDLVLCDIGLPELDGYEVARALRSDSALRDVRAIAVTGYARPEDVARAKEAGFDTHLAKPIDLAALAAAVASAPIRGDRAA